ncbi:acyl-CoA dehydrogenase family protein [Amycolatopsis sp. NPDC004368]
MTGAWDLSPSAVGEQAIARMRAFMAERVHPAEQDAAVLGVAAVLPELKAEARRRDLWNLGLPGREVDLSTVDYAFVAELSGRSPDLAPQAINGSPPDSVSMLMLHAVADEGQRERWLRPLMNDEIRSAFAMTEPAVASSDASNIATRIERQGEEYVVTGRKWFAAGAADPRCEVLFVVGCSDPSADRHRRHSVIAVPTRLPGVKIVRTLKVMGRDSINAEVVLDGVRVPARELLGREGEGFAIGQVRLGSARVQHCMRLLGLAERGFDLLKERARTRHAFGGPIGDKGLLRAQIAECRLALDQARLLVLHTAKLIDEIGLRAARTQVSAIKVVVVRAAMLTLDRAIQVHGALGMTDDVPLAEWWTHARSLNIGDGPEEVHLELIARSELARPSA